MIFRGVKCHFVFAVSCPMYKARRMTRHKDPFPVDRNGEISNNEEGSSVDRVLLFK